MARCKRSILLYGDSGDGKSAQVGEVAEHVFATTKKKTILYSGDGGGFSTIQPLVNVGIIKVMDCFDLPRPWEWFNKIVQGMVLDDKGKWVPGLSEDVGMLAYEGFVGFGDLLMADLAEQTGKGANIGGQASVTVSQGDTKFGSNNQSHFGIVQGRLVSGLAQTQRLPLDMLIWTTTARRGQDQDTNATILGPQAVGKALTSELPRMVQFTFRLMVVPGNPILKKEPEYRLYLRDYTDPAAQGAKSMGNDRVPMGATPLPEYIAPASVVKALAMIDAASAEAEVKLRTRLGMKVEGTRTPGVSTPITIGVK